MLKIVDAGGWDFGEAPTRLVKVASRGLRGHDLRGFLKGASASLLPGLDDLRPGEVPSHALIVGATERYGPNRNGDGFRTAVCRARHDTFRKYGHWFRDHDNRPNSLRYGRILKSAYNEPMARIELLVGYFGDAKAAAAGHPELGRVADLELEALHRGEPVPCSMSCRIHHDVCSFCGNEAASRDAYCDTRPVKHAGRTIPACSGFGCRDGLTQVADDGRVQYVDNPDPLVWFDASTVGRNADRIAFGLGLVGEKAAAAGPRGGAARAERARALPPPEVFDDAAAPAWARAAAKAACALVAADGDEPALAAFDGGLAAPPVGAFPAAPPALIARALADAGCVLGVRDFLKLAAGVDPGAAAAAAVAAQVPAAAYRVAAAADLPERLARHPLAPAPAPAPAKLAAWAAAVARNGGSARPADVARRAVAAACAGAATKAAALATPAGGAGGGGGAEALAGLYAEYAALAVAACPALRDDPLALALVARSRGVR